MFDYLNEAECILNYVSRLVISAETAEEIGYVTYVLNAIRTINNPLLSRKIFVTSIILDSVETRFKLKR